MNQAKKARTMDISQHPSGIYFLIFSNEKGKVIQIEKFMKE